jgi:hypothetical protein
MLGSDDQQAKIGVRRLPLGQDADDDAAGGTDVLYPREFIPICTHLPRYSLEAVPSSL